MPLINFLTWSAQCAIVVETAVNQKPKFPITDTKFYVLLVALSAQDNAKLLQQLETDFKGTIDWNKYQSKPNYRHETGI